MKEMEVNEPIAVYDASLSVPVMRAMRRSKYSLSELKGIIALNNDSDISYDDMRQAYMREKYSL